MAYRIEYDPGIKKYEITTQSTPTFASMLLLSFGLFLLLTALLWPEGAAVLRDMVIPGEDAQTLQAISVMTAQLQDGAPLTEAITTFCREIIHGAAAY